MSYFTIKIKNEAEIVYLGILKEFFGKKLGGYILSEAIKISWSFKINRVWVHTCSLDHHNALKNYLSRGMKIYKTEILYIEIFQIVIIKVLLLLEF